MNYAELHCLSNFTFLKGASHPEELMSQAEALGYRALAITDECSVAGVVRAYAAKRDLSLNIKLIVGSEFRLEQGPLCVLLCPDRAAYAELSALITRARRRCEKGQYLVYRDDLKSLRRVLVLWSPDRNKESNESFAEFLNIYHKGRSWIMYERHLQAAEAKDGDAFRRLCCDLSHEHQIPLVCAGNVHMHHPERQPLQDVLTAIDENTTVQNLGLRRFANAEHCLRPFSKLRKLYHEQDLAETVRIAERCHFDLSCLRYEYPGELVPKGFTAISYLKRLVEEGMAKRFPDGVSLPIQATIRKELKLIEQEGYEYFFLTVYDIVRFAQSKGILYQGRGSAANSIVCYCLQITSVDPRQISVLFERFISKERNEPPDIDVDFEHQRREEVFQYIYQKYGRSRAALAATVITFRFRSAFRSVGKALGIEESRLDHLIRQVDRRDRELSWEQQLKDEGLKAGNEQVEHLLRLTQSIIGFPRHLSQHVGGFVISAGPLSELVPVENAAMAERTVIQWDKDDLETLGLLKVDVLALGMLSAIRRSFDFIRQHYSRNLSIATITAMGDDPKVYEMLQRGDSVGVFQVESRAQMSMLPRLKPASYYDLVIQIAIVRPGPIQGDMVHPYLRRRSGEEAVTYPSKQVQQVLARTMGVPIFQEQVIKLAMVAAGFSGGEADQLRRAMASWKRSTKLHRFRRKLVDGMLERGYDADFAERVYQQICGFGEYGFPESHAASFAVLAYVSAWLKYYYPEAFYAGLLNSLPMGFYSPSQLLQDARRHAVKVHAIDVNASCYDHYLEHTGKQPRENAQAIGLGLGVGGEFAIRLGFRLVRGLSSSGCERLLQTRHSKGPFTSLSDVKRSGVNQGDLQALASADAFKSLSGNRYQARWELMGADIEAPLWGRQALPSDVRFAAPDEWQSLREDYVSTGLSLERHPMALLRAQGFLKYDKTANVLQACEHKSMVSVSGVVTGKQSPGTAGGVSFFTLEDETGNINVVIWRATARAQKKAYLNARLLRVTGILENEAGVVHIIAGRLEDLGQHMESLTIRAREFH